MSPRHWLEATRPKTLPAAAAPVGLGAAFAVDGGVFHWPSVVAALAGAILIQIGTNFANDYFDFRKGADTNARLGPRRATAAGLVTPGQMKFAFITTFALAAVVGTYLIGRAGWPLVVVGVLSIASGILYTGGPKPLGYLGLGDIFVLVFFGPVAVAGTVFVQAPDVSLMLLSRAALVGLAPGALATAILVVNNLRDVSTDVLANKRTLAVRFGASFVRVEYACALVVAFWVPTSLAITGDDLWLLLPLLASPLGVVFLVQVRARDGAALNPLLGRTGALLMLHSALFALGLCL